MCIEDVKIGRASRSSIISTVLSAAAVTEILPEDKHRFAIVISPPTAGFVSISDRSDVGLLTGIILNSTNDPLVLNIKDHGEMVRCKLFALASAGTPSISVLESSFHLGEWEKNNPVG